MIEKAGYQREAVMRQSAIKEGVVQDQWLDAIPRHEAVLPDAPRRRRPLRPALSDMIAA